MVNPASLPLHSQKDGVSSGKVSMDTNFFEEYQKQFSQWQNKFFDTWVESIPDGENKVNLSDTFEKTLSLQQDLVETALKTQKVSMEMAMEAQEKFWDQYFELLRRMPMIKTEEREAA